MAKKLAQSPNKTTIFSNLTLTYLSNQPFSSKT